MAVNRPRWLGRQLVIVICLLAASVQSARAQSSELVSGRVINLVGEPIRNVEVQITSIGPGSVATARTDQKGHFSALFHELGTGYRLTFRIVGYEPFTRVLTPNGMRGALDVGDVTLSGAAQVLRPLVANATSKRKIVPPKSGTVAPLGGGTMDATGAGRFLPDPSDLNDLTKQLAGVVDRGDSGYSVVGASPSGNRTVVDGMDFGGGALPRDAIGMASLTTSSAAPSSGQFSGGQLTVISRAGDGTFSGRVRTELIDPHLAWSDPASTTDVPRTVFISGYLSTPSIISHKVRTFLAFDASSERTGVPTLLAPRNALLEQFGVSPDSVARLRTLLENLDVPLGAGLPDQRGLDRAAVSLRSDYRFSALTSLTFFAIGNFRRLTGGGLNELAFPGSTANLSSQSLSYRLTASTFFDQIQETAHLNFAPSTTSTTPSLASPAATVLVGTSFPGQPGGLTSLGFGGGGSRATGRTAVADFSNELTWTERNLRHMVTFTQEIRHDAIDRTTFADAGAFTFESLDDLAAIEPASFVRRLTPTTFHAGSTTASLSLGDLWRAARGKFEVQAGVRYDRRTLSPLGTYNPAVDSSFAVRTDRLPVDGGWSPRIGFEWHPTETDRRSPWGFVTYRPGGGGVSRGRTTPTYADGVTILGPDEPLVVQGSFGAYRGLVAPARAGLIASQTGLPGAVQYLDCVGSATPTPDWSGASIPSRCADGSNAAFAAIQSPVTTVDPAFRSPVSWRGNIELTGWRWHGWGIGPQASFSAGRNVESAVDLNLRRTAAFTLPAEGNRPVFAAATAIVANSGFFAPGAAAVNPQFGSVTQIRSDLSYNAGQFIIAITPPKRNVDDAPFFLTYALNVQRSTVRGFNATTAGDPFNTETIGGSQPQHQFALTTKDVHVGWLAAAARVQLLSGVAYTPVVANDINGDGLANDRAFIFDPNQADTALAQQLRTLLANAPDRTRACLESQLGRVAAANSCRTPWRVQLDLNLQLDPPAEFALGDRFRVTMHLLNASGALVRLFGLENTPLGRSASSQYVDSRLLYVTGFDPARRAFTYRVNQLFGQPLDFGSARQTYPPFELQLGVEYRFGYPKTTRAVFAAPLLPKHATADSITRTVRAAVLREIGGDPLVALLANADSLHLTTDQRNGIRTVAERFENRADSAMAPIQAWSHQNPGKVTRDEIDQRIGDMAASWRSVRTQTWVEGTAYLTPDQRAMLPALKVRGPN
ncbi:MAG TPA: carboxypeptidase-like regulatory domain-containing protein [Gemmatimonadales bacterium]|jgi:hypothetical protein